MKTMISFIKTVALVSVALTIGTLCLVACVNNTHDEIEEKGELAVSTNAGSNATKKLRFVNYYLTMPELDIRKYANEPGRVDTLYAGDEVVPSRYVGDWIEFSYEKDGMLHVGACWSGAVSVGVRIHLLEDAYIFRKPGDTTETPGAIVAWREPSDPDLLVLWEENDEWLYVLSLEDCRAGYMLADTNYEIIS